MVAPCYLEKCLLNFALSQSYSSYKSYSTAKGLDGIVPSGIVTFISCRSSWESGDVVMVDRALIYST